jgi:hypothetical protein
MWSGEGAKGLVSGLRLAAARQPSRRRPKRFAEVRKRPMPEPVGHRLVSGGEPSSMETLRRVRLERSATPPGIHYY